MIEKLVTRWALPVHDPFAGTGERLKSVCSRAGREFSGTEIEPEFIETDLVKVGDATDPLSYPNKPVLIVTSPTYANGVNDHFNAGDTSKRYTYRSALGRDLDERNTGRYGFRSGKSSFAKYWNLNRLAVEIWASRSFPVVINISDFISGGKRVPMTVYWKDLLRNNNYHILEEIPVVTPRMRNGENRDVRVPTELVFVAEQKPSGVPAVVPPPLLSRTFNDELSIDVESGSGPMVTGNSLP